MSKQATVTREQILALAETMSAEKLASWYEFGLFLQTRALEKEISEWERASDADWLNFEEQLAETK